MKYLLFAGHVYYPQGGASDFQLAANEIEPLKEYFANNLKVISRSYIQHWAEIVEAETMKVIERGRADEGDPPEKGVSIRWEDEQDD